MNNGIIKKKMVVRQRDPIAKITPEKNQFFLELSIKHLDKKYNKKHTKAGLTASVIV
jgi:hypothetical protein